MCSDFRTSTIAIFTMTLKYYYGIMCVSNPAHNYVLTVLDGLLCASDIDRKHVSIYYNMFKPQSMTLVTRNAFNVDVRRL